MHRKMLRYVVIGLILLLIQNTITIYSLAQQQNVSLTDFKYQLIRTTNIGNRQAYYFNFWITFTNTGDASSDNITVYFEDPELNAKLEINTFILQPNQNTTLIYEDWPTTLTEDFIINITYNPTNPDVEATKFNSGKKQYTISTGETPNNDTPGFESILFLLSSILAVILISMKKERH